MGQGHAGFAGATQTPYLFEKFEGNLSHTGDITRAAVETCKGLEDGQNAQKAGALLIVADNDIHLSFPVRETSLSLRKV